VEVGDVHRIDTTGTRPYLLERVEDAAVVQLYADGFEALPVREKILTWHLYRAALAGRDIYYDQRYAHSLEMREVLEQIFIHAAEAPPSDPGEPTAETIDAIRRYTKLFWLNSGPYNNLTARKFVPRCAPAAFAAAARLAAANGARFSLKDDETLDALLERLTPFFFDPAVDPICTNKSPGAGRDILQSSANNLYRGVTMGDLEAVDEKHPLNSRLVKRNETLIEEVYRVGGLYGDRIQPIVEHLEAAMPLATEPMAAALAALVRFYRTGETRDREAYDIAWVRDRESQVDTINGFVEVYMDARGTKGAWEALVYYVNREKTEAIRTIAREAQWFEDHMPWEPRWRKPGVQGVTANAIDVVVETGDCGPVTPVGINLPNDQRIREHFGSKSVALSNVLDAYERSTPAAFRREFSWTPDEADRAERWNAFASELTTNMHEVIGHGSGRVDERLGGNPQTVLKEQYSALEESRADLVGLYFIADERLVELGLVPGESRDEIVLAEYEGFTRNALVQLRRVREGSQLEEDHMRNRQMIVHWLIAHTRAVEVRKREGRTYYVMTDAAAFRAGVGRLLAEVQRIKSTGDYNAARALFESHGIHFDTELRDEVLARVEHLDLPSYTGFVMPRLQPLRGPDGEIADIEISYPLDLASQMLEYSGAASRGPCIQP
jgi:dipeptidyl-peptidase-3